MRRKRKTNAPDGVSAADCVNAPETSDEPIAPHTSHGDKGSAETKSVIQPEGVSVSANQTTETHAIAAPAVESAIALNPERQSKPEPSAVTPQETSTFVASRSQFSDDLVEEAKRYFSSRQGERVSDDLARNYLGSLVDFVMLFRK
ncbi:MAG: hypothetical protein ACT6Q5_05995 [Sphingopyxis solisilvae]|uniref:hypothetical protein n=1 Tax=Sphingopyxis solisilvae TaxID=1886788 RepID=UPI00403753DC